jgi:hypothetical protein
MHTKAKQRRTLQGVLRCFSLVFLAKCGAGNRNRTYDLRITNAPLYQLSYSGKQPLILRCGT